MATAMMEVPVSELSNVGVQTEQDLLDYPSEDARPTRDFATINALGFLLMLTEQPGLRGPWNWSEMEVESNDSLIYGASDDSASEYEKDISLNELKALKLFEPEMEDLFTERMIDEFKKRLDIDPEYDPEDLNLEYKVNSPRGGLVTKVLSVERCSNKAEKSQNGHAHLSRHTFQNGHIVHTESSTIVLEGNLEGKEFADFGELKHRSESDLEMDIIIGLWDDPDRAEGLGATYTIGGIRKFMTGRALRHEEDTSIYKFEIRVEFDDDVGIWHEYVHNMIMHEEQAKDIVMNARVALRNGEFVTDSSNDEQEFEETEEEGEETEEEETDEDEIDRILELTDEASDDSESTDNDELEDEDSSSQTREVEMDQSDATTDGDEEQREELEISYEVVDQANSRRKRFVRIHPDAMDSEETAMADAEVAEIFESAEQREFRPLSSPLTRRGEGENESERFQLNDELADEILGDYKRPGIIIGRLRLVDDSQHGAFTAVKRGCVTDEDIGEETRV